MSLLTTGDISWMQSVQQQAMPGTVVIERYSMTGDGMGGAIQTWTAVGTAIMRIYPMVRRGQAETVAGGQLLSQTQWFGTGPVGTDVRVEDRLVYENRSWEVLRTNNDEMWKTAVRCELESSNEERRV